MSGTDSIPGIGAPRSVPTSGELDLLVDDLTAFEENKRLAAARRLGALHDRRAVQSLIGRLHIDGSPAVRQAAVEALYAINDPIAWPEIAAVLKQDDAVPVRVKAAEILGLSGDKVQSAPLLNALEDESQDVRRQAAIGIGKLQDTSVLPGLVAGLAQVDGTQKKHVADYIQALCALGGMEVANAILRSAEACKDATGGYRPEVTNGTYELQKAADRYSTFDLGLFYRDRIDVLKRVGTLRVDYTKDTAAVLVTAVRAMEHFKDQESVKLLCQIALEYREPSIRWLALCSLHLRKAAAVGDSLDKVLRTDSDWIVRKKAAEVMGELQVESANALLCDKVLNDSALQVQHQAIRALGKLALLDSLPTLAEVVQKSPNEDARLLAVNVLGRIKSEKVLGPLTSALGTDRSPQVRARAATALGEAGYRSAEPYLVRVMANQNEPASVRISAAGAAAKLGNREAANVLYGMLSDLKIQAASEVVQQLVAIKTEESTTCLIKIMSSQINENLRCLAFGAIIERPSAQVKACLSELVCSTQWWHCDGASVASRASAALIAMDQVQACVAFQKAINLRVNMQIAVAGLLQLDKEKVGGAPYAALGEALLVPSDAQSWPNDAIAVLIKQAPTQAIGYLKQALYANVNVQQVANGLATLRAGNVLQDCLSKTANRNTAVVCIHALKDIKFRDSYRYLQIVAGSSRNDVWVRSEAKNALSELKAAGEPLPRRGIFDGDPYWTP